MAILNNLIVNGNSRILNTLFCKNLTISGTTTFNTITVSSAATFNGSATFNSSVTVKGTSIEIFGSSTQQTPFIDFHYNNSTADYTSRIIESESGKLQIPKNFQVVGAMTTSSINNSGQITSYDGYFRNNLRATYFDLQYVAELGGAFYVSPTIIFNTPTKFDVSASSTTGYTKQIVIEDASLTSTKISGITWNNTAKIKASGTINGIVTGTMEGKITNITATSSSHTMTIQLTGGNVSSIPNGSQVGKVTKFSVMVYNINSKPVGILLNCYGQNDNATIDIYGGDSTTPNVAIGLLEGRNLPSVGGQTVGGWGIFTDRGYFQGTIAATKGLIGGISIDSQYGLYTNGKSSATSTATGFYISKDGAIYLGAYNSTNKACPFQVTAAGALTATSATISGTITAGANSKIGPWTVTASSIYKGNATMGTTGTDNMYFGNDGLSISNTFKVSDAGVLTASGATISGAITATTGTIGGVTANSSYGLYTNSKTSATSTNTGFLISKDGAIYLGAYNSTTKVCPFQVTAAGVLTATSGKIGGWTIESNAIEKHMDLLRIRLQAMDSPTDGNYAIRVDTRTSTSDDWANKIALGYGGYFYAGNATIVGTITANTGYIGGTSGWTIDSQQLSSGTIGSDSSMFLGTKNLGSSTSIAGRAGSDWRLTVGSHFGVTNTGAIYANTGTIGGWTIGTSALSNGTYGSDSSLFLSTANMASKAIAGTTLSTWRFTVGSHFGVTNTGALYANSVNIAGTFDATSIKAKEGYYIYNDAYSNFQFINVLKTDWNNNKSVNFTANVDAKAYILGSVSTQINAGFFSSYVSTNKVYYRMVSNGFGVDVEGNIDFTAYNKDSNSLGSFYFNQTRVTTASDIHFYNADSYGYPDAKNCASGSNVNFGSITVPAGVYLIEFTVNFASNSSGRREVWISGSSTGSNHSRYAKETRHAVNGAVTFVHGFFISPFTEQKTWYLVGYQNSGSTLSCTYGLRAISLLQGTDYSIN